MNRISRIASSILRNTRSRASARPLRRSIATEQQQQQQQKTQQSLKSRFEVPMQPHVRFFRDNLTSIVVCIAIAYTMWRIYTLIQPSLADREFYSSAHAPDKRSLPSVYHSPNKDLEKK